jgi:hypothetical protein
MNRQKELANFAKEAGYCKSVNPLGTNKEVDHGYLTHVYQDIGEQIQVKSLLEIGLMWGNSLKLWSTYFNAKLCVGIENGASVSQRDFESFPNVTVFNKDAFKRRTYKALPKNISLVIDDANHTKYQQSRSTSIYVKKLQELGVMVVEDVNPSKSYIYNILRSIPPSLKVKVWVVDLTTLENKLPNSICVVIQLVNESGSKSLNAPDNFWVSVRLRLKVVRIAQYYFQILLICPIYKVSTSLKYRLEMLMKRTRQ